MQILTNHLGAHTLCSYRKENIFVNEYMNKGH